MNWAKKEALRIVNAVGFKSVPADVIAEALQGVANQCAELAYVRSKVFEANMEQPGGNVYLARSAGAAAVIEDIRVKFPRESSAK